MIAHILGIRLTVVVAGQPHRIHANFIAEIRKLFNTDFVNDVLVNHNADLQLGMAAAQFTERIHVKIVIAMRCQRVVHALFDKIRFTIRVMGGHVNLEAVSASLDILFNHFQGAFHRRTSQGDIINHTKSHIVCSSVLIPEWWPAFPSAASTGLLHHPTGSSAHCPHIRHRRPPHGR